MTHTPARILLIASENDALPGAKAGGVGDVVRDVPRELARRGCQVTVVIPAYGSLARLPGAERRGTIPVWFAGVRQSVAVYEVQGRASLSGVTHLVLDHPFFAPDGPGLIYCHDADAPFATDATKFALLSRTVAEGIVAGTFGEFDILHLNDWHTGLVLALREADPRYAPLRDLRTVFTIHNLALQGRRPLTGTDSSWSRWYPTLAPPAAVRDPENPSLGNPMAAGIRLANAVHVVSPSYAEEITRPSAVRVSGFYGGEGLEGDLRTAEDEGRMFGILNGCDYPTELAAELTWPDLIQTLRDEVARLITRGTGLASAHYLADERLRALARSRPTHLLTSVSRVAEQKIRLMREPGPGGRPTIHGLLDALDDGLYVFAGTGDPEYARFLTSVSARRPNFVFINGYTNRMADALYASGDLYVMPSSYEPCGISQMLAMRAGQPCLVHHVGGLRDTVIDGETGFAFTGTGAPTQARQMVERLGEVLHLRETDPAEWQRIRASAEAARFHWTASVDKYLTNLYAVPALA